MSPEIALVAVLALLVGPTVIWLAIRAMRAADDRGSTTFNEQSAGWLTPVTAPEPPQLRDFWRCRACSSINHAGATRCYGCMLAREQADPEAVVASNAEPARMDPAPALPPPARRTRRPIVPVMDAAATRSVAPTTVAGVNAAKPSAQPWDSEVSDPEPVALAADDRRQVAEERSAGGVEEPATASTPASVHATASPRRRSGRRRQGSPPQLPVDQTADVEAAIAATPAAPILPPRPVAEIGTTPDMPPAPPPVVDLGTEQPFVEAPAERLPVDASPAPQTAAGSPPPDDAANGAPFPSVIPVVCPLLGLLNDHATHYSVPDPRNRCFAPRGRSIMTLGRSHGTGERGRTIDVDSQSTLCLSQGHISCARYIAAEAKRR